MKNNLLKALAVLALCVAMLTTLFACEMGDRTNISSSSDSASVSDSVSDSSSSMPDSSSTPDPVKYGVSYVLGDGANGSIDAFEKEEGDVFDLHDGEGISKDGHDLIGWNDGSADYSLGASYEMPAHDVTLTAVWAKTWTLTYDLNGGDSNLPAPQENIIDGTEVTLDTDTIPVKDGFGFIG